MKKTYIMTKTMIMFFVIGTIFLGSCTTTNSIENINPIDLGKVDYRDYRYITIHSDHETNLSYVSSSPGVHKSCMQVEKTLFYPELNDTKYRFEAREIKPDPYFISENKSFIYQDVNSGKLFSVTVDYQDVEIPKSELQIDYETLQSNHTDLTIQYLNLTEQYKLLDNLTEEINNSLNMKIEEYQEVYGEYNTTYEKLEKVKNDFQNLTEQYSTLMTNYTMLNNTYNETYHNMMEYSTNLSGYKTFVDKLDGYSDGFYWEGQYYYTPFYYETKIEKLEDDLGMTPIYIIIAIVLTVVIGYLLFKRQLDKYTGPIREELPYSEKSQHFTKNFLNTLKETFKTKQTRPANTNMQTMQQPDNGHNLSEEFEQKLDTYQQETNQKISNIDSKIDQLLSKNGYSSKGETTA